jgi:LPS export ABC transporter protein LptC
MRALVVAVGCAAALACSDRGVTPTIRGAVADSADQVMQQMSTEVTRGGVRVTQVQAESAWVFNARQVAELKKVTMVFFDPQGVITSTVTADSGTYRIRDGFLEARGNVVAVTPAPTARTLKTEHLIYDKAAGIIRSDTAYTFTSAEGSGSGMSFETDPDFRRLRSVQPRGRQRGQGFLLPGEDTTGSRP